MEFVYGYVAGIRSEEPGFKRAVIAPHPDIRIKKVQCRYESVNGTYASSWEIAKDGTLAVHVEVPFDCEADVMLPGYEKEVMVLTAGSYDFSYMPKEDFRKPYSKKTTLMRISKDENAMAILGRYTPALAGIAASGNPEMGSNSLEDLLGMGYLPFDPGQLQIAIGEIENVIVA
jgi:alpha-L-rhamnosidase